ncbi:NADH-quinone oxidoreductase subunit J [bacterium]|nr:NADH-quinone oxidoreductase subunit J [bacterium]
MGETILFYIFGGLALLMVFLTVIQKNPVASALCLVMALFNLAGLYVLLMAPFVAVMQVLVYAGAIMVLFIFVVMLLKLRDQDLIDDQVTLPKLFTLPLAGIFIYLLVRKFLSLGTGAFPAVDASFGAPKEVGKILFADYLIPFEITSVLLLVSIIGVVLLAKKESR